MLAHACVFRLVDKRRVVTIVFVHVDDIFAVELKSRWTRSTIGGGRECNKFVPVLGENGTKIFPTGDIFDQFPGQMR